MGIPGYFSHIIKNYPNIIRNLQYFTKNVCTIQHLFMDCNSIIYDAYNNLCKTDQFALLSESETEKYLIDAVIGAIEILIQRVSPTETIMIAFDGVAPLAKMDQQRTRRYRSDFITKVSGKNKTPSKWNTAAITPGTPFMEKLSKSVEYAFRHSEGRYRIKTVVVSCSNIPGEGEHKIMDYIRSMKDNIKNENVALYGLDSDLIMLSIFQLDYCKNIYVFREATEFIKSSIPASIISDASNLYFLDIFQLATFILKEMNCQFSERARVYDYVFMCFLLGNDFLPHFPSLNIRTSGINTLMDIYRIHIGSSANRTLISLDRQIQWRNVSRFLNEIAKIEHPLILNEYSLREKRDRRIFLEKTDAEREDIFQNTPMLYRGEEQYICPKEPDWEDRYYRTLFPHFSITESSAKNGPAFACPEQGTSLKANGCNKEYKKTVCMNYLEGLQWVFQYYVSSCPSWRWRYKYSYPPLLNDLVSHIPHFDTDFIPDSLRDALPFTHDLQLAYVLPKSQLHLLTPKIRGFLLDHYPEYFVDDFSFQWAFCRYFWESHPLLPDIPVDLLEQWDMQFRMSQSAQ
jgi:hypothetical protein